MRPVSPTSSFFTVKHGPHTDLIVSSKSGSVSRSKDRRTNLTHQSNSSAIKSTGYPQTHLSRGTVAVHHRHPDNLNSVAVFDNLVCVQITHKVPRDFVALFPSKATCSCFPETLPTESRNLFDARKCAGGLSTIAPSKSKMPPKHRKSPYFYD